MHIYMTLCIHMRKGGNSLHLGMDAKVGGVAFQCLTSLYEGLCSTCDCVNLGVPLFNVPRRFTGLLFPEVLTEFFTTEY